MTKNPKKANQCPICLGYNGAHSPTCGLIEPPPFKPFAPLGSQGSQITQAAERQTPDGLELVIRFHPELSKKTIRFIKRWMKMGIESAIQIMAQEAEKYQSNN